jgi:hypothetical protein
MVSRDIAGSGIILFSSAFLISPCDTAEVCSSLAPNVAFDEAASCAMIGACVFFELNATTFGLVELLSHGQYAYQDAEYPLTRLRHGVTRMLTDVAAGTSVGRTEDENTRFAKDMMLWSTEKASKER